MREKEKRKSLQTLSIFLIVFMIFSMWPTAAFAETEGSAKAPTAIKVCVVEDNTTSVDGKYYGVSGESFTAKAYDENGKETPVTWSIASWNKAFCEIDPNTGKLTFTKNSTSGGSSMLYVTATSTVDGKTEGEISRSIEGWSFGEWQKNNTITLSEDGQSLKTVEVGGGVNENNIWNYEIKGGIAKLERDPGNSKNIKFIALRPGRFTASFTVKDKPALTDTANFEIKGLAVEDMDGNNGKTYINIGKDDKDVSIKLKAFCEDEGTVVSWESSKKDVATVDAAGLVSVKKIGTTLITATDDKGTKGGIKVVVGSSEKPLFEKIELLKNPLTEETYVNEDTFEPEKLEYDIEYKNATASALTFLSSTLYDTEKFNAVAEYKDEKGIEQKVPVNSGKITMLKEIPFDSSVLRVTISENNNEKNRTVYIFNIKRPRDASGGNIKTKVWNDNGGLKILPEGRDLKESKYKGYPEGTIFSMTETGETDKVGIQDEKYIYGTLIQGKLEAFKLAIKTKSEYAHIRYSTDDGKSWKEIEGRGSGTTETIKFDAGENVNHEKKILIQTIDDASYMTNKKTGKEPFGVETKQYTLNMVKLPEELKAEITELKTDKGEIYSNGNTYKISVPFGSEAPNVKFRVSDKANVKTEEEIQVPDNEGVYTYTPGKWAKKVIVTSEDGLVVNEYKISYSSRGEGAPDKVVDYLCVNSQYTNGGGFGTGPEGSLSGSMISLGNFGGYITYYYDKPLIDNPNNKYGVDLYIFGNANVNFSTADKKSFFEPGQVWISEDGEKWYALAGSEHYEKTTIKDYSVTYTKTDNGRTAWKDNYGNSSDGSSHAGTYPNASIYSLCELVKKDSFSISGILLPAADGSITGDGATSAGMVRWGYVDALANNTKGEDVNPYQEVFIEDNSKTLKSSGFDLAWAVDEKGNPINTKGKEFHYVKIVTASNIWHNAFNEKSTEVSGLYIPETSAQEVGKTEPKKVTVSDGVDKKTISFEEGKQIYSLDLGDMKYVSISVDGLESDANIYVNNQRIGESGKASGIKVTGENGETTVRILAQEGEKEPAIKILKLTGSASESNEIIEGLKVNVGGSIRKLNTDDGNTYKLSVGHKIKEIGILPIIGANVGCTINGEEEKTSYKLSDGKNVFEIEGITGEKKQKVLLEVKKEKEPELSGDEITVYFELLGDSIHGETGEPHTYKFTPNKLEKWIPLTSYRVPKEFTVLDVFEKALKEKKFAWVNADGNYISEINGLAEFSNGPDSGWMYTLNGRHPLKGVAEQTLNNGDLIVFHYTDDYKKEEGSELWNTSAGDSDIASEVVTDKNVTKVKTDIKKEQIVGIGSVSINVARVTVKEANVAEMLNQAKEKKSSEIVLNAEVSESETDKIVTELPKKVAEDIVSDIKAALTVKLPETNIKLEPEAIKEIITQAKGDKIIIESERVSNPTVEQKKSAGENAEIFSLTVKSGDGIIHSFGAGVVTVTKVIPTKLANKKVAAVYFSENGTLEVMKGRKVEIDSKSFYEFVTSHFSEFALVDADESGIKVEKTITVDEAKAVIKLMKLKVTVKKLNKSVKITAKLNKNSLLKLKSLKESGYIVKYAYYRSNKINKNYKAIGTKTGKICYSSVAENKGKTYFYKARVQVYDSEGTLIARTSLKNCKAAMNKKSA